MRECLRQVLNLTEVMPERREARVATHAQRIHAGTRSLSLTRLRIQLGAHEEVCRGLPRVRVRAASCCGTAATMPRCRSPAHNPSEPALGAPWLEERIETLQECLEQLKTRQARIEARKRALASRRARKDDTRRRILAGAVLLSKVESGDFDSRTFRRWLDKALTLSDDLALFGLDDR
jgi:hypothetical protein